MRRRGEHLHARQGQLVMGMVGGGAHDGAVPLAHWAPEGSKFGTAAVQPTSDTWHAEAARAAPGVQKGAARAAPRMSSPYVGRSPSTCRTRGDGMCGGTPFVLVGSCVAARYARQVRAAWSCVHASKTSLKFKGTHSVHAFLHTKRPQHDHDDDEPPSLSRLLSSRFRVAVRLHAARAHGHEPL